MTIYGHGADGAAGFEVLTKIFECFDVLVFSDVPQLSVISQVHHFIFSHVDRNPKLRL